MRAIRRFFDPLLRRCTVYAAAAMLAACAGTDAGRHSGGAALQQIDPGYRQEVVMSALSLIGSSYRYGGTDPQRGFDCSGLVNYVFRTAAHTPIPRDTARQAAASRRISARGLQGGDLVFFNTLGRSNSHVGIYIGDRRFVNAPSSGGRVRIDSLDSPYFSRRFTSARSLFAQR